MTKATYALVRQASQPSPSRLTNITTQELQRLEPVPGCWPRAEAPEVISIANGVELDIKQRFYQVTIEPVPDEPEPHTPARGAIVLRDNDPRLIAIRAELLHGLPDLTGKQINAAARLALLALERSGNGVAAKGRE